MLRHVPRWFLSVFLFLPIACSKAPSSHQQTEATSHTQPIDPKEAARQSLEAQHVPFTPEEFFRQATTRGHEYAVGLFLQAGMDPNSTDSERRPVLMRAAAAGHEGVVRRLIDGRANVNATDSEGQTALMGAARYPGWEAGYIVELLLAKGAAADVKDAHQKSALLLAAETLDCCYDSADVANGTLISIGHLLKSGADANIKDTEGKTALMWAAQQGYRGLILQLLEHGAEVNAKDVNGKTALMWAAQQDHVNCAAHLLDHGADVQTKDHAGKTALLFAAESFPARGNAPQSELWSGCVSVMDLLLQRKADIDAADNTGKTALMWAAEKGDFHVVHMLLDYGANESAQDRDGKTVLMRVIENGDTQIADLLRKAGAKK